MRKVGHRSLRETLDGLGRTLVKCEATKEETRLSFLDMTRTILNRKEESERVNN